MGYLCVCTLASFAGIAEPKILFIRKLRIVRVQQVRVIALNKRAIIAVLALLFTAGVSRIQSSDGVVGFSGGRSRTYGSGFEGFQLVSVAHDPSVVSYPTNNMSPFGPEAAQYIT